MGKTLKDTLSPYLSSYGYNVPLLPFTLKIGYLRDWKFHLSRLPTEGKRFSKIQNKKKPQTPPFPVEFEA